MGINFQKQTIHDVSKIKAAKQLSKLRHKFQNCRKCIEFQNQRLKEVNIAIEIEGTPEQQMAKGNRFIYEGNARLKFDLLNYNAIAACKKHAQKAEYFLWLKALVLPNED